MSKIAVIGLGYVGLANALALAQKNEVVGFDVALEKIRMLHLGKSPIRENAIEEFLKREGLNISFSNDFDDVLSSDFFIIATPTDYDPEKNYFNTSSIESVIEKLSNLSKKIVIIKSTVPVGYTEELRKKYKTEKIIFSPEFLREGRALEDVLSPSRIIVGEKSELGENVARIFVEITENNPPVLTMDSTEAEAVKLFSNTYLANRVVFFNELDTYTIIKGLNTKDIIAGVSTDPRIGQFYNNPSFGYGGYCLPKDTRQLLASYIGIPSNLISAIIESNKTRKHFIVSQVINRKPKTVGVYRLIMKSGSDNSRSSSILDIIKEIENAGIKVIIFEPTMEKFNDLELFNDFTEFARGADLIIANRFDSQLDVVRDKVYTRDLYGEN